MSPLVRVKHEKTKLEQTKGETIRGARLNIFLFDGGVMSAQALKNTARLLNFLSD